MPRKAPATKKIARSAVNGKFVTLKFAKSHPRTTEIERVKRAGK